MGATSLIPAKREVKREATKAWQAWPGNQTSSRCLVRSLVSLAGCFPHLLASRPCPLQPWVGAVGVRGASVRTRRCPQGCLAQGPTPKNRSEKKSPENSSAPCQRKVIRNECFRAGRGLYKILSEAKKRSLLARAKSPAACRGGGGPQYRNAQGFLCFGPF